MAARPSLIPMAAWWLVPRGARRDLRAWARWVESVAMRLERALAITGNEFQQVSQQLAAEAESLCTGENVSAEWRALGGALRRNNVPRRHLVAVVDGWSLFFVRQRPRDETQVETMLQQAAGSAMRVAGQLTGIRDGGTLGHLDAFARGVMRAVLLRSLPTQMQSGRAVFAEDALDRFSVSLELLAEGRRTPQVQDLIWHEAKQARAGLARLDDIDATDEARTLMLALRMLRAREEQHLARLEAAGWDVWSPVRESAWQEWLLAWRCRRG